MLIGYVRVSRTDQHLDLQKNALQEIGCQKIFEDKVSGIKKERPGLLKMMEHLREGDTFVFWKLDRSVKKILLNGVPAKEIAKNLNISIPTLYRWIPESSLEGVG